MPDSADTILHNDEGMWLPNRLPLKRIADRHNVNLPPNFGEEVMKRTVRMNNGGSASFVSPHGLIATNHHVAESILSDLSSESKDYIRDGFYAKTQEEEIPAPELEVNVLCEIEDVTLRVKAATPDTLSPESSHAARDAVIAEIEKESFEKTGLRSDVVTLYQGGVYHLYRYKRYRDVRVVFAPEKQIASFGGDFDNYEYPRYCLDIAFLRVYENGTPLSTPDHFVFKTESPKNGDLLFIAGHPGTTDRLSTYAHITYLRDHGLPHRLDILRRYEISLQQFSGKSPESKRRAGPELGGIQNGRKRYVGQLWALQEPNLMARVHERERALRNALSNAPKELQERVGDPWDDIEKVLPIMRSMRDEINVFENLRGFRTEYMGIARTIVRLLTEDQKPNAERLPEFGDARRESLLATLYAPTPLYDDLETWKLADSLAYLLETFTEKDSMVRTILNGKSPRNRASELISTTSLKDIDVRKRLIGEGVSRIGESKDSMIALALFIDERARSIRKKFETEVEEVFERAHAKIAEALFNLYGEDLYPDATFTLRVAVGTVQSFNREQMEVPSHTVVSGIVPHGMAHNFEHPWDLPPAWDQHRKWIESSTSAFNFITTHDTHGGNSGSPVFTKELEIVGLLFDGIMEGQGDTYVYTDEVSRSVSVHAGVIIDSLTNVYHADRLVKELRNA